ncbi:hypothetical protein [Streptomyces sp. HUAS ZL42]|uniref:hypothetical protein n=1 Tax=Streptomyces sp. HUAS ZL42 TaxID=3231715 RepID=UPI00345ECBD2
MRKKRHEMLSSSPADDPCSHGLDINERRAGILRVVGIDTEGRHAFLDHLHENPLD